MSIFALLGSLFKPASDIIDKCVTSEEERLTLQNQLAQIEAKVSIKMMELQSKAIDAQAKMESSIQEHGNVYTKSIRPTISLLSFITIMAMGFGFVEFNELIVKVCGGFLGVYAGLRSWEKKK